MIINLFQKSISIPFFSFSNVCIFFYFFQILKIVTNIFYFTIFIYIILYEYSPIWLFNNNKDSLKSFFLYSFTDKNNVTIYFSFDVVANYAQIKLTLNDIYILTIVQEGVERISIENDLSGQYICYYYEANDNIVKCTIKLSPYI